MTRSLTSHLKWARVIIRRGLIHVQVRERWWRRWRTVKVYNEGGEMIAKKWAEVIDQQQQLMKYGRVNVEK